MNEPHSQFLKLSEATLQSLVDGQPVSLSEATVPKPRIVCCALTSATHEAPERRRFAYVEKRKKKAFVIAQNYEIQGSLSLKGTPEAVAALGQELGSYFPVADATVRHVPSNQVLKATVAIVNKAFVSLLQIGDHE
ncbi:MAG: hypothetical protein IT427_01840 [Pirellulales bacterium]|nr:hypothetical protein [Pirellulales bacterium]